MPLIPDIRISVQNQSQLILDPVVKSGQFQRSRNGQLLLYAGGFTAVFPVIINGEKWAFRCWHVPITDASKRLKLVSEFILNNAPPYLVPLEYTPRGIIVKGEIFPTTRMKWIEGKTIKKYLCDNVGKKQSLLSLASTFLSLIENKHRLGISHGDLQHGNILVTENEDIFLVDYDSMYVPTMGSEYKDEIVGKEDYQHPKRKNNKISNKKVDYFSELIIYLSIIALAENDQLAAKYKLADSECLLFSERDYRNLRMSAIYKDLRDLNIPLIDCLLEILCDYLTNCDINNLKPFNEYATFIRLSQSEEEFWQETIAQNNIGAFRNYIRQFPSGRYYNDALNKIDEIQWSYATRSDNKWGYEQYLNDPLCLNHRDEANRRLCKLEDDSLWQTAKEINTIAGYKHYLNNGIIKFHTDEANKALCRLEKSFWAYVCNQNTKEYFELYLREFPSGRYINECRIQIDKLIALDAEEELWTIARRQDSLWGYRNYLKNSKHKKYQRNADEKIRQFDAAFWMKIKNCTDLNELRKYIKEFPDGKYVIEAQKRIKQIDYKETLSKVLFVWIIIIVFWGAIYLFTNRYGMNETIEQRGYHTTSVCDSANETIVEVEEISEKEKRQEPDVKSEKIKRPKSVHENTTIPNAETKVKPKPKESDESRWQRARHANTKDSYQKYCDNVQSDTKHLDEAKARIAIFDAREDFDKENYSIAKHEFERGEKYLDESDYKKYAKSFYLYCLEYSTAINDANLFLTKFPDYEWAKVIKGRILRLYCDNGKYKEARNYLQEHKNEDIWYDETTRYSKNEWRRYIRRHKQRSEEFLY